jgi:hypothetical protein
MIEAVCSHSDSLPCFDLPTSSECMRKLSKQCLTTHQTWRNATREYGIDLGNYDGI